MDKIKWDSGPWQREPDRLSWVDEETGYLCVIQRHKYGHLCGYVGTKFLDEGAQDDIRVHGGITWQHNRLPFAHAYNRQRRHWYGFDCAHAGDLMPGEDMLSMADGTYKPLGYVLFWVMELAKQLKGREKK